jgi:hypothetical protein
MPKKTLEREEKWKNISLDNSLKTAFNFFGVGYGRD